MTQNHAWNNSLRPPKAKSSAGGGRLQKLDFDRAAKLVLGSRKRITSAPLIMLGSDVSGELHLGHLALFSVAETLAEKYKSRLVVSLNEVESLCSRKNNLKQVVDNQRKMIELLRSFGLSVHSRAKEETLLLFALRLWRLILSDKNKLTDLNRFYSTPLDSADILSVITMAVTPLFLARQEKVDSVLMVYGLDEAAHLEYIYKLYKTSWFKKEVESMFGGSVPEINYVLIRLLPDLSGRFKMSKTRADQAIAWRAISSETLITRPIEKYLMTLIEILGSTPRAGHNRFLDLAGRMIF